MTFEDLPENWPDLPLTEPTLIADVVDLLLGASDRVRDSLLYLPCTESDTGVPSPIIIDGSNWRCTAGERRQTLAHLAGIGFPAAVVAVSSYSPVDAGVVSRWHTAAREELDMAGVRLLGFCSASVDEVRFVPSVGSKFAA